MLDNKVFYHGTTKKAIIAFGNMFSNIWLERSDQAGNPLQRIKVPVTYGPKEKFLAREIQQPDIDAQPVEMILPRLAFEITGFERDAARQMNSMQRRRTTVNGQVNTSYQPVPYNLNVNLYAIAKTQDDALQMVEQIIPWFTPSYTLTINAIPEMNLTDELAITLEGVTHEDNYDELYKARREIVWTFSFVLTLNYFGPVDTNHPVIKRVEASVFSDAQMTTKVEEIDTEVVPFTANREDDYTILTTIEGF